VAHILENYANGGKITVKAVQAQNAEIFGLLFMKYSLIFKSLHQAIVVCGHHVSVVETNRYIIYVSVEMREPLDQHL